MVLLTFKTHRWVVATVVGGLLAGNIYAQQTAAASSTTGQSGSPSAFDSYKAYADEAIGNWRSANDTVAKIGGWREYARQAQQPESASPVAPESVGKSDAPPAKSDIKVKP